jgi:hypothetical protein
MPAPSGGAIMPSPTKKGLVMAFVQSASKQGRAVREPFVARGREDLFRQLCAVIHVLAPRWDENGSATILVIGPGLTRALVKSTFDEICEQHHVVGIELRFQEREGTPLRAIFRPARSAGARESATRPGNNPRLPALT